MPGDLRDEPAYPGDVEDRLERLQRVGRNRIGRHDADFQRQHQRDEDDPENHIAATEAEIDDRESRHGRKHDFAGTDRRGEDDAVEQLVAEVGANPGGLGVFPEMRARRERQRHAIDRFQIQRRRDDDDGERQERDHHAERKKRIADEVEYRRAFDHVRDLTCSARAAR
ncbi:hypothetical protein ACVINH_000038 [Rhizobium anhuiense]